MSHLEGLPHTAFQRLIELLSHPDRANLAVACPTLQRRVYGEADHYIAVYAAGKQPKPSAPFVSPPQSVVTGIIAKGANEKPLKVLDVLESTRFIQLNHSPDLDEAPQDDHRTIHLPVAPGIDQQSLRHLLLDLGETLKKRLVKSLGWTEGEFTDRITSNVLHENLEEILGDYVSLNLVGLRPLQRAAEAYERHVEAKLANGHTNDATLLSFDGMPGVPDFDPAAHF